MKAIVLTALVLASSLSFADSQPAARVNEKLDFCNCIIDSSATDKTNEATLQRIQNLQKEIALTRGELVNVSTFSGADWRANPKQMILDSYPALKESTISGHEGENYGRITITAKEKDFSPADAEALARKFGSTFDRWIVGTAYEAVLY